MNLTGDFSSLQKNSSTWVISMMFHIMLPTPIRKAPSVDVRGPVRSPGRLDMVGSLW